MLQSSRACSAIVVTFDRYYTCILLSLLSYLLLSLVIFKAVIAVEQQIENTTLYINTWTMTANAFRANDRHDGEQPDRNVAKRLKIWHFVTMRFQSCRANLPLAHLICGLYVYENMDVNRKISFTIWNAFITYECKIWKCKELYAFRNADIIT